MYTDLRIAVADLAVTHPSFQEMSRLDYRRTALHQLLVENTVTGCVVMINRALRNFIVTVPEEYAMHDWWLALTSSAFGRIVTLEDEQTVLYRQHAATEVGAKDASSASYVLKRLFRARDPQNGLQATYCQAKVFLSAHESQLSEAQAALLREYARIPEHGKLGRLWWLCKLKTWKHGVIRVLGQILFI